MMRSEDDLENLFDYAMKDHFSAAHDDRQVQETETKQVVTAAERDRLKNQLATMGNRHHLEVPGPIRQVIDRSTYNNVQARLNHVETRLQSASRKLRADWHAKQQEQDLLELKGGQELEL